MEPAPEARFNGPFRLVVLVVLGVLVALIAGAALYEHVARPWA